MNTRILLLSATCLALAPLASAQIVPTGQERRIEAVAILGLGGGPMESEVHEATDLGLFQEVATAHVEDTSQGILADAGSSQISSIQADRILAQGSYNATVEFAFTEAEARNRCRFEFTVPTGCLYELTGRLEAFDFGGTNAILENVDGTSIFAEGAIGFSESWDYQQSGYLPAGDYIFRVNGGGFLQDGSPFEYASGSYQFDIQLRDLTTSDCGPIDNSTGAPALLGWSGPHQVASFDNRLTIQQGPPGQFGVFFYGASAPSTPFGSGVLCISSPQYRLPGVLQLDSQGATSKFLDWASAPLGQGPGQVLPGSTWTFQFWYRDVLGGSSTFNTSSALTMTFE